MNLLSTESFESVFGAKKTRKRPKLENSDLDSLLARVKDSTEKYEKDSHKDSNIEKVEDFRDEARHDIFEKGTSKRIWAELYKVLDCSDIVIHVLDARNVPGTRCQQIEKHLKQNAPHKQLIFVINKCDLVPNWVTKKWVRTLSKTVGPERK